MLIRMAYSGLTGSMGFSIFVWILWNVLTCGPNDCFPSKKGVEIQTPQNEAFLNQDKISGAYFYPDSLAIDACASRLWLYKRGKKMKQTCYVALECRFCPQRNEVGLVSCEEIKRSSWNISATNTKNEWKTNIKYERRLSSDQKDGNMTLANSNCWATEAVMF